MDMGRTRPFPGPSSASILDLIRTCGELREVLRPPSALASADKTQIEHTACMDQHYVELVMVRKERAQFM